MPDYSFISQPQVADSFKKIGSMVDMARGATALQKERGTLEADIERAKAEASRAGTEATVAAGTAQPRIAQANTAANSAAFKLSSDQAGKAMEIAGGLRQDKRIMESDPEGTIAAAKEARQQMIAHGIPEHQAEFWSAQISSRAHEPGGASKFLENAARSNAGASAQAAVVNAPVDLVPTPAGALAPIQRQPGAPGGIQPVPISSLQSPQGGVDSAPGVIPAGVPPAQRETPITEPVSGNVSVLPRDQSGRLGAPRPITAGAPAFQNFPAGETPQTRDTLTAERDAAKNVAISAGIAHATNRGVLEEIDKAGATGTAGPTLQKIASAYAGSIGRVLPADWAKSAEGRASAYDMVGKYLERNALNAAASMGPQTNAYLEAQIKANGSLGYNIDAIKKITKFNDAIVSGSERYHQGLEKAIEANPQGGVFNKRQFDSQWAKNFDPAVMQLYNAHKAGDKQEMADIERSVGGANSARAKELEVKAANLAKLVKDGHL